MNSGDKYQFTVRPTISGQPRVTQIRIYLEPLIFKTASHYHSILAIEKEKGKKSNKELVKMLTSELHNLIGSYEKHEYFSNNSVYFQAIGKFIESSEGWYNTKKL